MSQQTVNFGEAAVAEPPAPMLPGDDLDTSSGDNRRKLMMVGAGVGVLVIAIVAFFLLKGGGSPAASAAGGLIPHGHPAKSAAGAATGATAAPVTLPKHVAAPVGRDPFKPLYVQPASGGTGPGAASASSSTTSTSAGTAPSSTSTSGGTSTTTSSASSYHPVWVQLKSVSSTSATFEVGYSNGKSLQGKLFTVKAPVSGSTTSFAGGHFTLLSDRNGSVFVQYGDGTPMKLDMQHNFMVVD